MSCVMSTEYETWKLLLHTVVHTIEVITTIIVMMHFNRVTTFSRLRITVSGSDEKGFGECNFNFYYGWVIYNPIHINVIAV